MERRRIWAVLPLLALLASLTGFLWSGAGTAYAQEPTGPNLLRNGDFEEGGAGNAWPLQDNIPEVQVAPGWRAFWLDNPPSYAQVGAHCNGDPTCSWARPEFRNVLRIEYPNRVHSGEQAQKYFTFGRQHEAGLFQQVSGIEPGTKLRFTAHMHTWSCTAEGGWNNCPTSPNSNRPAAMHTRVGIDPTGGTNPWAETVVWSGEFESYDTWTPFWVEATAEGDRVTVFTYSRADWTDAFARLNNDVYVDNASLVMVGEAEPTAPPPPPTSEVPPTPRATATPLPSGAVVHTVAAGDTLFGIAIQYGVDVDELRRLNAGSLGPNDMLQIGQEVVISGEPIEIPTPTPASTEEAPIENPTAEAPAGGDVGGTAEGGGTLCVTAYHDQNGDMFRQSESEALLPNVTLTLLGTNGPAATYTTDGISEPYCFQGLAGGNYILRQSPPAGYLVNGPQEWGVLLGEAQVHSLSLGYARTDTEVAAVAPGAAAHLDAGESLPTGEEAVGEEAEGEEDGGGLLTTVLRVSGIIALVLALGVAGLFGYTRLRA